MTGVQGPVDFLQTRVLGITVEGDRGTLPVVLYDHKVKAPMSRLGRKPVLPENPGTAFYTFNLQDVISINKIRLSFPCDFCKDLLIHFLGFRRDERTNRKYP
jgi:hypothetical protein